MLKKFPGNLIFLIFILAVFLRFLYFSESVYFGWDEARDAYISQDIYLKKDIKILGPVANYPGINHGPLYWYIVGPLYLFSGGDVYFVSAVFRIINALGVFLVYLIGKKFFNTKVGLLSSIVYAFSFEQSQYAIYFGHPALGILAWMGLFYGAAIIFKDKNHKGLILMFASAALAFQFSFILFYTFIVLAILLFILRRRVKNIKKKSWIVSLVTAFFILSNFIIAELKFNFQMTKAISMLVKTGYDVMPPGETRLTLYYNALLRLFHDNILAFDDISKLFFLGLLLVGFLIYHARSVPSVAFILVWIFSGIALLPFGGYNAYYVNVGIGIGVIIGFAFFLERLASKSKTLAIFILVSVVASNLILITKHNKDSLIVEIKAQQYMKLSDELKILDKMYSYANGRGFTVRATSMPYGIQTVWAYLFNEYGKEIWGYLPYWEKEIVQGYPGVLPRPQKGTTCVRYLVREPVRGIPVRLIEKDEEEENLFSKIDEEIKVGHFNLQVRSAHGECHNDIPE